MTGSLVNYVNPYKIILLDYLGFKKNPILRWVLVVKPSGVSNYIIIPPIVLIACLRVRYTKYTFTRSVHQLPAYASSALIKH